MVHVRGYAPATPCWAELTCSDPARAVSFYRSLFGWDATTTGSGSTVFTWRDLAVAGVADNGGDPRSAWLPYISSEDLAATTDGVVAGGGTVVRPPAEVGTRGRAALFADAEGAVFGGWQRGAFRGAQVASEPSAVCWHEIATWDVEAALAFYGKALGWTDKPGEFDVGVAYREWQAGNRVVAGLLPMAGQFPTDTPAHWRVTVEVDDCAAVAAQCSALGGRVLAGPMDVGVGQYAQLLDPVSATIGVIELLPELRLTP